jgi:hypothetical protein
VRGPLGRLTRGLLVVAVVTSDAGGSLPGSGALPGMAPEILGPPLRRMREALDAEKGDEEREASEVVSCWSDALVLSSSGVGGVFCIAYPFAVCWQRLWE